MGPLLIDKAVEAPAATPAPLTTPSAH